jgi:HAD superfamily hydrolase (TIGR01509 family)
MTLVYDVCVPWGGVPVIRSLIWDAGGTLFDTYPAVVSACRSVLSDRGIEIDERELLSLFRQTTSYAIRKLSEIYDLSEDALGRDFRNAYLEMPPEAQSPFPGVRSVCRYIRKVGGSNFIVTHRDWQSLQPLLDHYEMRALFAYWITEEDPYPRKPSPASIRAVINKFDLNGGECLAIGDREIDLLAARRAGVRSCFFNRHKNRSEITADLVVSDFYELLAWLKKENNIDDNEAIG